MVVKWEFAAEYFTYCNCDWGCPCNFNARPTQGNCHGVGVWRIKEGRFGSTKLDGTVFATAYFFPGLVENGNAIRRMYIDRTATAEQRKALIAIDSGKHGGGVFEIFPKLSSKSYPPMVADIEFRLDGPNAFVKIDGILEAESGSLSYPDGTIISPTFTLPHGIEFKEGLATNAKRWWIKDEEMLAHHENVYGAVAFVKFNNKGCVG
jgi:hypothetical protein